MSTTTENKINHIYHLLKKLAKGEEIYPQSEKLQKEMFDKTGEASERALRRYLKDIYELYSHIVLTEKKAKEFSDRKVTIYRVADRKKDVSEILRFFLENSSDLGWLLQSVHDNDPTVLDDSHDKEALQAQLKQDANLFLFKSNPFENFEDEEHKKLFNIAKNAVKNREYRSIDYRYPPKEEMLSDCKLLKMVFMNNNWYLAIEDDTEKLRFLRFNFIRNIGYSKKTGYQKKVLEKYSIFFKTLQNPMTLNQPFETARILASQRVAHYFQENMKPFFPSQKFIRENEDGSVEFSIDFTQPLEILPFIKQWQPDLTIISPDSLRETMVQDLKQSMKNHL